MKTSYGLGFGVNIQTYRTSNLLFEVVQKRSLPKIPRRTLRVSHSKLELLLTVASSLGVASDLSNLFQRKIRQINNYTFQLREY